MITADGLALSPATTRAVTSTLPGYAAELVQQTLNMQRWTFAKTMPKWPHFYTVSRWWSPESPLGHRDIMRAIAEHGVPMAWGNRKVKRHYLDFPDPATGITWRYWHMGSFTRDAWTDSALDVINRQDVRISTCVPVIESPPPPQQQTLF